jgi:hypothetical protein
MRFLIVPWLLLPVLLPAQQFHTYVGRIDAESVLLAWGTTAGSGNTIGSGSASHGRATVRIGGKNLAESWKNWVLVRGLQPSHQYPYEVLLENRKIGWGKVRTWPRAAAKLAFLVIGDYGTGDRPQYEVAEAMRRTLLEKEASDNPVRFVLTTGDNIYADRVWFGLPTGSGARDQDWESKFFRPYEELLRSVPFYPTLGNHDGDETESRGDLAVYLDNFFFPAPQPSRYYSFSFGGLADFFALDSTGISTIDGQPIYAPRGRQLQWLEQALPSSIAPWKIPYFHNPPFTAGPKHAPSLKSLQPFVDLFGRSGVKVVFNGHEHNFQWSEQNGATRGVRYVTSGAGGQLRAEDVRPKMQSAGIAGWAPERHFLLVEIENRVMTIHVKGAKPFAIRDRNGKPVAQPLRATL